MVSRRAGGIQILVKTLTGKAVASEAMKRVLSWATMPEEDKSKGQGKGKTKGKGEPKGKQKASASDSYGSKDKSDNIGTGSSCSKGHDEAKCKGKPKGKGKGLDSYGGKGKDGGTGSSCSKGKSDGDRVCGCGIIHSKVDDEFGWPDTFLLEGKRWACTGARPLTEAERDEVRRQHPWIYER